MHPASVLASVGSRTSRCVKAADIARCSSAVRDRRIQEGMDSGGSLVGKAQTKQPHLNNSMLHGPPESETD
eukprot:11199523-Alexandrium_andersonii.AAC.1